MIAKRVLRSTALITLVLYAQASTANTVLPELHQPWKIFTDNNHQYQLLIPSYAQSHAITSYFIPAKSWTLAHNFEANANDNQGKIIKQFIFFNLKPHPDQIFFPSYFYVGLRVSVNNDPAAIANCLKNNETLKPLTYTNKHNITFTILPFEDAGMSQILKGESYRTIHNGQCWAIERFETGNSSPTTDPSPQDISLDLINNYYIETKKSIDSFNFC